MNILFLAYFPMEPSVGGIQRVTDILVKELVRRGHDVSCLSLQLGPEATDVPIAPQYYINVEQDTNWEKHFEELINERKIEYIINQSPNTLTNRVLKLLKTKAKIVSVFHTQPFLNDDITRRQILNTRTYNFKQFSFKYLSFLFPHIRSLVFGLYEKQTILNTLTVSDKVCFISERIFSRVLHHIPDFPKEKLAAINNPNTFVPNESESKKENLIVWVGRVENGIKNTIDFVKIWEMLYNNHPSWNAIVAGDGNDLEIVKKYAYNHQIANIQFIGRCSDVESLYQRAKIVVVTSFSESWCMVLTEGLAHGCVVCAYDTYETVHDIINGSNGFVSTPNPKAMAAKLDLLMNKPKELEKMSKATFNSIKEYNVESIVNQWEQLLKSL